jgi:Uma2 family endonuclease
MRNRDYHRAEDPCGTGRHATLDAKEGPAMARPVSHPETKKRATYQDVIDAPEHLVAEILGGELVLTPRPTFGHANATGRLFRVLGGPFVDAFGGPGGWVLQYEMELHFSTDGLEVLAPDLAGWRRERLSQMPTTVGTRVAPDWVCETLSPSTEKIDRTRKMAIYAREGVGHLWLLDPRRQRLETYRLADGSWELSSAPGDPAREGFRAEPFDRVALDLSNLWKW